MSGGVCPVRGCLNAVRRNQLMCASHSKRVPEALRAELAEGYQAWLREGRPPKSYVRAARNAIAIAGGYAAPDPEQRELTL